MQIIMFIFLCLYLAWTGLIIICCGSFMISKYLLGNRLPPLTWNWLPKVVWTICTIIVLILYFKQ